MDIGPIWRAMLRNKAGFVLIALQVAVTLTIMVNAVGIIQEHAGNIGRDSGVDEANTFAFASVLFGIDNSVLPNVRILVERNPISSTTPSSPPVSIQSPTVNGRSRRITTEPKKFDSVSFAARASASPAARSSSAPTSQQRIC